MLTGSADNTARLWDARTGKTLQILRGHTGGIRSVAYSPDDKQVVTASADATAQIWDVQTGQAIRILTGHTDVIWRVAYSSDGRYIVTGSQDGLALLQEASTGNIVRSFLGHVGAVLSVSLSPDGKVLLTGGADGVAYLWDTETGWQTGQLEHGNTYSTLWNTLFFPDGQKKFVEGLNKVMWGGWDPFISPYITSVAISPDSKAVLAITRDGNITALENDSWGIGTP